MCLGTAAQACLDESLADLGPGVGNRAKSIAACRGHHVPEKVLQHLSLSQRGPMLLNVVACLGAPRLISGGVFLEGGQIH